MFMAWLPVVRHQAQLGNWMSPPDLGTLIDAAHAPKYPLALLLHHPALIALLALLGLLVLGDWSKPSFEASMLASWWRSLDRAQRFALFIPFSFAASTLTVWIFSKVVFPVFNPKYFFPNILLHIIWLSLLVHFVFNIVRSVKYELTVASVFLAAGGIIFITRPYQTNIPCFDPARNAYLEDRFKGDGPMVALGLHTWMTRLNRSWNATYLVNDDAVSSRPDEFLLKYILTFATWANKLQMITTADNFLNANFDFIVLDDDEGQWFKFVRSIRKPELIQLARADRCTLWRVRVTPESQR
jgi:hypothetical protein